MIRRWHVEPDIEVETASGVILAISLEAIIQSVADACVMSHRAGGGFSVWFDRYPTGLEGEMVTTGALVEWRDRTDAKAAPERKTGRPQQRQPDFEFALPPQGPTPEEYKHAEPPPEDDPTQYRGGELVDDIGDGIDPNALPEEDDSEIEVKA